MEASTGPTIERPSVASLLIAPQFGNQQLSTATGFVVVHDQRPFLITNWHVVSGRNAQTGEPLSPTAAIPDRLTILHNVKGHLGAWEPRIEPLLDDDGRPRWLEHPAHGRAVDAVALPLSEVDGVEMISHDVHDGGPPVAIHPGGGVNIIGFPFGRTGGFAFAIWIRGTLATEPVVDYENLPCFLVDSRTRPGQSGSPVLLYVRGGLVAMEDGGSSAFSGPVERFLGVYSGRIHPESDLGIVWKREALQAILTAGVPGSR